MLKTRGHIILLLALVFTKGSPLRAQHRAADSIKALFFAAGHDTLRCNYLSMLIYIETDDELWPKLNDSLLRFSASCMKRHPKGQPLYNFYKKYYANALNNIGYIARQKGDIPKALEYYEKSLKLFEEVNEKEGIAQALNNIANIYIFQGDNQKAVEYFSRSLALYRQGTNRSGVAVMLNNIGAIFMKRGDTDKAFEYFSEGLKILEETGEETLKAYATVNLGKIYSKRKDYQTALSYLNESLAIRQKLGDDKGIAQSLSGIASVQLKKKEYKKALEYSLRAMEVGRRSGYPENISETASLLHHIYSALGDYKNSLLNYELHVKMRDSISNETTQKVAVKMQMRHEYEKKAVADSVAHARETEVKNAELSKQNAEIKAKRNQQYGLFSGLVLLLIFAAFMYNRFKITQRQKTIIEKQKMIVDHQKKLVEEKQSEILDSIHYAKRIQNAQLPSEKYMAKKMQDLAKLFFCVFVFAATQKSIARSKDHWLFAHPGFNSSSAISTSFNGKAYDRVCFSVEDFSRLSEFFENLPQTYRRMPMTRTSSTCSSFPFHSSKLFSRTDFCDAVDC